MVQAARLLIKRGATSYVTSFSDATVQFQTTHVNTQSINILNVPYAQEPCGCQPPTEYTVNDAKAINTIGDFNTASIFTPQQTFKIVIGKHGLVTLISFFEPIHQSLSSLEDAVDTLYICVSENSKAYSCYLLEYQVVWSSNEYRFASSN